MRPTLPLLLVLLLAGCGGSGGGGPRAGDGGSGGLAPGGGGGANDGGSGGDGGAGGLGGTGGLGGNGGDGGTGGTGGIAAPPRIDAITPDRGHHGLRPVVIDGANFSVNQDENEVRFGGVEARVLAVTRGGARLETEVPAGAVTGPVTVEVRGVVAEGPVFTVENPVPVLADLFPDAVRAGGGAAPLRLAGTGFLRSSRVEVDGVAIPATWRSATLLEADVPAATTATEGTRTVRVVNAEPGGGASSELPLAVEGRFALLRAIALDARRVRVDLDEVPADPAATSPAGWTIAPAVAVTAAARVAGLPRSVVLTLAADQTAGVTYAVTAPAALESEGGIAIRTATASFRGWGSAPAPVRSVAAGGCGAAGFSDPVGIAIHEAGIFVTERDGNQVQVLDLDGGFRSFVGHDGTSAGEHAGDAVAAGCPAGSSEADGSLTSPYGIAAWDPVLGLFVGDARGGHGVHRFVPGAVAGSAAPAWRWDGSFASSVPVPTVLGFAGGHLHVACTCNYIRLYEVRTGGQVGGIGSPGEGPGQFHFDLGQALPAMAVSDDGRRIVVSDPGNQRVQRFDDRTWTGRLGGGTVAGWDQADVDCCAGRDAPGWFSGPRGVAFDPLGRLWVADVAGGGRLQLFDEAGRWVREHRLGFLPGGVSFHPDGTLWVTDPDGDALRVYLP